MKTQPIDMDEPNQAPNEIYMKSVEILEDVNKTLHKRLDNE